MTGHSTGVRGATWLPVLVLLIAPGYSRAQTVTAVNFAGSFDPGDAGSPLLTPLQTPGAVAVDGGGNVYIADSNNHRVRKLSPSGQMVTVLGNGIPAGADRLAWLNTPQGLAVDSQGSLYVADTYNHRVLLVTTSGTVSVVAGNGTPGFSGDNGSAPNAQLFFPAGLALDSSGNLYIADSSNQRVREVAGGTITTVAGNGSAGFGGDGGMATAASLNGPSAVAVDTKGNLYIADFSNHRIRMVTAAGVISTIAGNGQPAKTGDGSQAVAAAIGDPAGVAVDAVGNVFLADYANSVIRKVASSQVISTLVGTGSGGFGGDGGNAPQALLDSPTDVAADASGNLYVADTYNNRIRQVTQAGIIRTIAGPGSLTYTGDGSDARLAALSAPGALAKDQAGNLYISDSASGRVRKVSPSDVITTVAGSGSYGDTGDKSVAIAASFRQLGGVAVDSHGNLYIADNLSHRIRKVTPDGMINTFLGNGTAGNSGTSGSGSAFQLNTPDSLTVDAHDNLYVADQGNFRILKVTAAGSATVIAGTGVQGSLGDGGPAAAAQVDVVNGLAVDGAGNVYLAESSRVRMVNLQNVITTVATVFSPQGLSVDTSGNLYFADQNGQCIRRIAPDGSIATAAGSGFAGFAASGTAALAAPLNYPASVLAESSGNLFISDQLNHRVLEITAAPVIAPGGVSDAWTYTSGVAPGAWIAITGYNLAPVTQNWATPAAGAALPEGLGGVTVSIDGFSAPISYVSPNQINVLAPSVAPLGPVSIVVSTPSGASAPYPMMSAPYLPAVYSNPSPGVTPVRWYVTADDPLTGEFLGSSAVDPRVTHGARPGETIDVYAIGLGPSTPQFPTYTWFNASFAVASNFQAILGQASIKPVAAVLVSPGMYQVRLVVPSSIPAGDQPLVLDFGTVQSAANVYLTIQP